MAFVAGEVFADCFLFEYLVFAVAPALVAAVFAVAATLAAPVSVVVAVFC